MILYQNTVPTFSLDVLNNRIADLMRIAFEDQSGNLPQPSEYRSWQNSTQFLNNIVQKASLDDNVIVLEYEVPYNNQRIDCLLFGRGISGQSSVVIIELKQWDKIQSLEAEGNFLETYTGGDERTVPHPCQQVEGYHNHLLYFKEIFEKDRSFTLFSCAYCHNYTFQGYEGLYDRKFAPIIERHPLYSKGDVSVLVAKLNELLGEGDGLEIFNRFRKSGTRPSKKLLEQAAGMIKGEESFSLLQEQIVAKNTILSKIRKAKKTGEKSVIVVQGGPGTGKSVIAINILAELAGKNISVLWGCKSKPFVSALQTMVGEKAQLLFSNLYRFVPTRISENELDVVLVDEAHRIQNSSNFQFTPKEHRTDMPQMEQLVRCARTSVFFIDDKQNVRSSEIGSTALIMEYAHKYGASFDSVRLLSQFRCNGSTGYLNWVESALGYERKPRILTSTDDYDFRIFDSPEELYEVIKGKESGKPNSARLVAGYCWPWSDPNPDGSLVRDVVIDGFNMSWEAKEGKKVKKGIPLWYEWAYKTAAVEQVGCIYTAQGFEFDYIGLIFGDDLRYDPETGGLEGNPSASCDSTLPKDKDEFRKYVRNIYRVLMTRGLQGCYVYFVNKKTEEYFRSMINFEMKTEPVSPADDEIIPYENSLPLLDVRTVADSTYEKLSGLFREESELEFIPIPGGPFAKDRFLVRVLGDSMEPTIPDGSLCLFRLDPGGSRNKKIVLCLVEGFSGDSPVALVKRYYRRQVQDDSYQDPSDREIILQSDNHDHEPICMRGEQAVRVLGVFEKVIHL